MNKTVIENLIIEKIAKRHGIAKTLARKLYINTLIYNIVQEQIIEQADFLYATHSELL